jgi:ankyrin repeat protein
MFDSSSFSFAIGVTHTQGFTALHLAADRGHAPAVAYLLSLGADKTILDPDEQTALEIATISGRDDVVELLQ